MNLARDLESLEELSRFTDTSARLFLRGVGLPLGAGISSHGGWRYHVEESGGKLAEIGKVLRMMFLGCVEHSQRRDSTVQRLT